MGIGWVGPRIRAPTAAPQEPASARTRRSCSPGVCTLGATQTHGLKFRKYFPEARKSPCMHAPPPPVTLTPATSVVSTLKGVLAVVGTAGAAARRVVAVYASRPLTCTSIASHLRADSPQRWAGLNQADIALPRRSSTIMWRRPQRGAVHRRVWKRPTCRHEANVRGRGSSVLLYLELWSF